MRPFGYLRVSSRDQVEGYSLDQQRAAILAHCANLGWRVPAFFTDAGRSGFTDVTEKRPAFAAMLREAEAGGCDVVVVHRLDRFARSLTVTLRELKRLQAANVAFVSIGENMDFSTPIGRVLLAMLAALAEYFSENLSREVKKGLAGRRAAGFRHATLPYGARLVGGVGPAIEVDPGKADALRSLLTLVASGSYAVAVHALNGDGVPARRGGAWNTSSVRAVVAAASWLAEQPEPWPSLYLGAAKRLRVASVRSTHRTRMLTGLLRCGGCGGSVGYQPRDPHPPRLFCQQHCGNGPRHLAPFYEALVREWVARLPDEGVLLRRSVVREASDIVAFAELRDIRAAQERLGLAFADGVIGRAIYEARKAELAERERALPSSLFRVSERLSGLVALREAFPGITLPEGQNAALRQFVARVIVRAECADIIPHDDLAPLFAVV